MAFQDGGIVYLYSGGTNNQQPLASLGGNPSTTHILNGLGSLFPDITNDQAQNGYTDYRCVYLFNDSEIDTLYNSFIYSADTAAGATTNIGVYFSTEVQRFVVTGQPTGGYLIMGIGGSTFSWAYNPSPSLWAANLQTAINALAQYSGVTVTVFPSVASTAFELAFLGLDDNRAQELIQVKDSTNLTGSFQVSLPARLSAGSPINAVAGDIQYPYIAPTSILFSSPTVADPINIGHLKPGDWAPVWVQRTTPAGSTAIASDSLSLTVSGSPILFE